MRSLNTSETMIQKILAKDKVFTEFLKTVSILRVFPFLFYTRRISISQSCTRHKLINF